MLKCNFPRPQEWKFWEYAGMLHPLLCRVMLASHLLNLRLLGAPPCHLSVPKPLWKEGGRGQLLTFPGHWRPPRNSLHLFSWLLWLILREVKPSIKWAVMRALTSSQPCTLTCAPHRAMCGHKRLMLHLAIVKGLSRIGHPHEFPPNLVLHQCNDMMLLKYRQIKTKARRSYSPGTVHMNEQDKAWEEKYRKWFYLQLDHTSSKSNWASWTTYYLQPLSCCRMLPLQIGWQRTESSLESNRPGSSDSISKKITSNRRWWDAGKDRIEGLMPSVKRQANTAGN